MAAARPCHGPSNRTPRAPERRSGDGDGLRFRDLRRTGRARAVARVALLAAGRRGSGGRGRRRRVGVRGRRRDRRRTARQGRLPSRAGGVGHGHRHRVRSAPACSPRRCSSPCSASWPTAHHRPPRRRHGRDWPTRWSRSRPVRARAGAAQPQFWQDICQMPRSSSPAGLPLRRPEPRPAPVERTAHRVRARARPAGFFALVSSAAEHPSSASPRPAGRRPAAVTGCYATTADGAVLLITFDATRAPRSRAAEEPLAELRIGPGRNAIDPGAPDGRPSERPRCRGPRVLTAARLRQKNGLLRGSSQEAYQSGRRDLNSGPHRPERCALPGCATPRRTPC